MDDRDAAEEQAAYSPGPMSRMPIEWLIQVLEFLPTQTLFQIMSTNSEWESASRYILKIRKSLTIVCEPNATTSPFDVKLVNRQQFADALPSILNNMKNIKCLTMKVLQFDEVLMRQMIEAYANQLQELECLDRNGMFPTLMSQDDEPISFPNLRKLSCTDLDMNTAAVRFPKLEELQVCALHHVWDGNTALSKLRKFSYIQDWDNDEDQDEAMQQFLVKHAHQLVSLKILFADDSFVMDFGEQDVSFPKLEEIVVNDLTFARRCPALKSLKLTRQRSPAIARIHVHLMEEMEVDLIRMPVQIKTVLFQSISRMRNLKHLQLVYGDFSDEDLPDLFANMRHLEQVLIRFDGKFSGKHVADWTRIIHSNNKHLQSLEITSANRF